MNSAFRASVLLIVLTVLASCGAGIPSTPQAANPGSVTVRSNTTPLSWTQTSTQPATRSQAAAVTIADGSIFVLGGSSTNNTPPIVKLAAGASTWTSLPNNVNLKNTRVSAGAGLTFGGLIAVFGGSDTKKTLKSVDSFNATTNNIGGLPNMTVPRVQHAFASVGGVLYAIGGIDDLGNQLSTVETFAGRRWVAGVSLPESLVGASAAASGQDLFVFGGATASGAVSSTVYKLSGFPAAWTPVAPMPVAVKNAAAIAGKNNLIYVLGGSSGTAPVNTVQVYDTLTNTWSLEASLPVAISNASAAIDSTGHVLVIGGVNAANANVDTVYSSPQAGAPPVFTSSSFQGSVEVNQLFSYLATASGKPAPTFSLVTGPTGMTVDANGLVTWTPTVAQFSTSPQAVTIRASNADGTADQSFSVTTTAPAPSIPTGLVASGITETTATLSWNPATALIGTVSYEVLVLTGCGRSGCHYALVGSSTTTTLNLTGLVPGAAYSFYVVAVSSAGSRSLKSVGVGVVALRPAAPINLAVTNMTQVSVSLSWAAPASPVAIVGYRIYDVNFATQQTILSVDGITGGTLGTVTNLLPNSRHFLRVVSYDAGFNESLAAQVDVTTNSLPSIFRVGTFINPIGVGAYPEQIVAIIGEPLFVMAPAANPTAGQNYTLSVAGSPRPSLAVQTGPAGMSVDSATGVVSWNPVSGVPGNYSATIRGTNVEGFTDFSFNYTIYPAGTDLLAPTGVNFPTLSNLGAGTVQATWLAATDNKAVVGYDIIAQTPLPSRGNLSGGTRVKVGSTTDTNFTITNLLPNTAYAIYVVSRDAAGNSGTALYPGTIVTLP